MVVLGVAAVICVLVYIEMGVEVLMVLHGSSPPYSLGTGLEKLAIGEEDDEKKGCCRTCLEELLLRMGTPLLWSKPGQQ